MTVLLKMMSFVKEADLIPVREKGAAKRDTNPIHHGLNPDQETPEFSLKKLQILNWVRNIYIEHFVERERGL